MAIQKNGIRWENLIERHNLQALDVDGRLIFKTYFKDMMGSTGLDSSS
jgi:hypothetical protein